MAKTTTLALINAPNFDSLTKSINALASINGNLSETEKTNAMSIISDWKKNVIERLDEKRRKYEHYIYLFQNEHFTGGFDYCMSREELETIVKATKCMKQYSEYLNAEQALSDFMEIKNLEIAEEEIAESDITMTLAQSIEKKHENYAKSAKRRIEQNRLSRSVEYTAAKLVKAMKSTTIMQNFLAEINAYVQKVPTYINEAKDMAQLATINVTISDSTTRDNLRDLIDFSKKL